MLAAPQSQAQEAPTETAAPSPQDPGLVAEPTPRTVLIDFTLLRHPAAPKPTFPEWIESVQECPAEAATGFALGTAPTASQAPIQAILQPALPADIQGELPADPAVPFDPQASSLFGDGGLPDLSETAAAPLVTTIRIRLRSTALAANVGEADAAAPAPHLLLRLYFQDLPNARPVVTGWSETGQCHYQSPPLGAGLRLPASEAILIPAQSIDYLEITLPGDGRNLTRALLCLAQSRAVVAPLDAAIASSALLSAPLGQPGHFAAGPQNQSAAPLAATAAATAASPAATAASPAAEPSPEPDTWLFGRVRATLCDELIRLIPPGSEPLEPLPDDPQESLPAPLSTTPPPQLANADVKAPPAVPSQTEAVFEFNLEDAPLLALITLEILNADPQAPLCASLNGQPIGALTPGYPDLADPAYVARVQPLLAPRFHYAGWLAAQLILPGNALRPGSNTLVLALPGDAPPAAIRRLQLQLKHPWRGLDYRLAPAQ